MKLSIHLPSMNLFFLSRDPRDAAEAHYNKHVVKMVLETAQLLSSAHRLTDGEHAIVNGKKTWVLRDSMRDSTLYRATHANHPTARWVRSSRAHYEWTFKLLCALLVEYTFRYGKTHACTKLVKALAEPPAAIADTGFSDPPKCMPDSFAEASDDVVACYRAYYREGKKDLKAYKNREAPSWL